MNTIHGTRAFSTEHYANVEQRALCEWIEAVIYEETVVPWLIHGMVLCLHPGLPLDCAKSEG
jgi:hypothetical protein